MNPIIKNYIKKYYAIILCLDMLYILTNVIWTSITYSSKIVDVKNLNNYIYHEGHCSDDAIIHVILHNYYCHFPSENRLYCDLVDKDFNCYGIRLENNSIIHLRECFPELDLNKFKRYHTLFENCAFQIFLPLSITFCLIFHIIPIFIICLNNCKYINQFQYQEIP